MEELLKLPGVGRKTANLIWATCSMPRARCGGHALHPAVEQDGPRGQYKGTGQDRAHTPRGAAAGEELGLLPPAGATRPRRLHGEEAVLRALLRGARLPDGGGLSLQRHAYHLAQDAQVVPRRGYDGRISAVDRDELRGVPVGVQPLAEGLAVEHEDTHPSRCRARRTAAPRPRCRRG